MGAIGGDNKGSSRFLFIAETCDGRSFSYRICDKGGLHESRVYTVKKVNAFAHFGKNFGSSPHYNTGDDEYGSFANEFQTNDIHQLGITPMMQFTSTTFQVLTQR